MASSIVSSLILLQLLLIYNLNCSASLHCFTSVSIPGRSSEYSRRCQSNGFGYGYDRIRYCVKLNNYTRVLRVCDEIQMCQVQYIGVIVYLLTCSSGSAIIVSGIETIRGYSESYAVAIRICAMGQLGQWK